MGVSGAIWKKDICDVFLSIFPLTYCSFLQEKPKEMNISGVCNMKTVLFLLICNLSVFLSKLFCHPYIHQETYSCPNWSTCKMRIETLASF